MKLIDEDQEITPSVLWQGTIEVKGAASFSSLSWFCERIVRETARNLIGFSLYVISGIFSFSTNSHCEEITLSWRLIKVLCKVSTLLVRDVGHKKFSVICRNSVRCLHEVSVRFSLCWSLCGTLWLMSFPRKMLVLCEVKVVKMRSWDYELLVLSCAPWSEEKQSWGNPWYSVSNILIDVISLSSFLILLGPQMHSSYSNCNLLWGAWQSVLCCLVSLGPCMELGIGLCRNYSPCLAMLGLAWW